MTTNFGVYSDGSFQLDFQLYSLDSVAYCISAALSYCSVFIYYALLLLLLLLLLFLLLAFLDYNHSLRTDPIIMGDKNIVLVATLS